MKSDKRQMIEVDGVKVRVCIHGKGKPLLMFNGIGAHIEILDALRKNLEDFQTITLDMPGVGKSEKKQWIMRLSHHADFAAKVLDKLGLERVDLFGVSWGGALAQEFLLRHPERVNRAILAATTPGPGILMRPDVYISFVSPVDRSSDHFVDNIAPKLFGGKMRTQAKNFFKGELSAFLHPKYSMTYLYQLLAAAGWTSLARLGKIDQPVLIIAGTDDPIIRAYNARLLACRIKNAELEFLEDEGHFFIVTSPEETAQHVRTFLQQAA